MNDKLHYPTCPVWDTNDGETCTCVPRQDWRILKDPTEQFPWRVFRQTADGQLEELMGCSTRAGAIELVASFNWLRRNRA
jgi:hypothetical protein